MNLSSIAGSVFGNIGTATGVTWSTSQISANSFTISAISANSALDGTVIPRLLAGTVMDLAGNRNLAATDASDSVSFSAISLAVSINQSPNQADPTASAPVNFVVVFSRPVDPATFTPNDIIQNGTASGINWSLSSSDFVTWTLSATTVSVPGTIIPTIAQGAVFESFGNGNSASTSTDNYVLYDLTLPTLGFSGISPGTSGNTLLPTIRGTSTKVSTVSLYFDAGCTSVKSESFPNSVFASPGITLNRNVAANMATDIYAQAVDNLGNTSLCTKMTTYAHDNIAPVVTGVTSSLVDGQYKAGQSIPITVNFSKNVIVSGQPRLMVRVSDTDLPLNFASGSGSSALVFNYTVSPGDTSAKLDYSSSAALSLNSGSIRDNLGNAAVLTLPTPGAVGSLGATKTIVVDTTLPVITFGSVVPTSPGLSATPQVSFNATEALSLVQLFSDSVCSAAISPAVSGPQGLNTITTNSLASNASTSIFARGSDLAGNASSCSSLTSYIYDTISPTVTMVSSSSANGTYRVGQIVSITVSFTEPVNVTGTPQLTLATGGGALNAVVNYKSGSGSNTLVFDYTVAVQQGSSDLDFASPTALQLNGGSIKDLAGNNAVTALPDVGSANSLAGRKDIVIDTSPPTIAYNSTVPSSPGSSRTPAIFVTPSEAATVTLYSNSGCTAAISVPSLLVGGASQSITTLSLNANVATSIFALAVNPAGNSSVCTQLVTYGHDNVAPAVLSFVKASNQSLNTNSVPVDFTLTFSESIDLTTIDASKITNLGTALNVNWRVTDSGDQRTFTISAVSSGVGSIRPRILSGSVKDPAGNILTAASDSTDTVVYSPAAFSVALNQASDQVDPARALPIKFTAVFSGAVGSSSFTVNDITQTGTATGVSWSLSTSDNITWTISAVSATTNGSITDCP